MYDYIALPLAGIGVEEIAAHPDKGIFDPEAMGVHHGVVAQVIGRAHLLGQGEFRHDTGVDEQELDLILVIAKVFYMEAFQLFEKVEIFRVNIGGKGLNIRVAKGAYRTLRRVLFPDTIAPPLLECLVEKGLQQ